MDAIDRALRYYRDECSGAEPSISVFHRMLDEALGTSKPCPDCNPIGEFNGPADCATCKGVGLIPANN